MADGSVALPAVVADGTDAPSELRMVPTIDLACPACGMPVTVDALAVVRQGPRLIDDRARAVAAVLDMALYHGSDITYLRGLRETDGHGLAQPCLSCRTELLAVAAAGEVQPARYQVVAHGLVAIADLPLDGDGATSSLERQTATAQTATAPTEGTPRWQTAVALVAVLAFLAIPAWLNWRAIDNWRESRAIASSGVRTIAEVVAAEVAGGGPRSVETFEITYTYSVSDGATAEAFTVTRSVDAATFAVFRDADQIEIRYDPDDPGRSDVARNDAATTGLGLALLVDAMLVLAVIQVWRQSRRELHAA